METEKNMIQAKEIHVGLFICLAQWTTVAITAREDHSIKGV